MKKGLVFAIVIFLMIALACDDPDPPDPADLPFPIVATGGGWFETGEGKATFGFNGHVDMVDEEYVYKGQMQFNDHAAGVKFHGKVTFGTCEIGPPLQCTVEGTYRPQPTKSGESGEFKLVVQDLDEPGASSGDHFQLDLSGGHYGGRSYDAALGGGSIKIHVAE